MSGPTSQRGNIEPEFMENVIEFKNQRGETLRGVLHTPASSNLVKNIVIFPNGGVMGAEGDYRAYVSMARQITAGGYYVMRFSPAGLGYSDGDINDCSQKKLFNQIEKGLFVNDIKAAVRFSKTIENFKSITLSGICGGAISVFIAAAELNEVHYVIPIGIPVILDNDNADYYQRIAALDKSFILNMYLDKIFKLTAWKSYFSGKSDKKIIHSVIRALFQNKTDYIDINSKSKFSLNQIFLDSAEKIIKSGKKILFIFGDADGFLTEFNNLYLERFYQRKDQKPFSIFISHRSNHMFSLPEMQKDVAKEMLRWMQIQHEN